MKIRDMNLNSLIVFSTVFRQLSMTNSAKELGMTQPGVTQHIRSMENALGVELFHRIGKKLIPTKEAEGLFEGIHTSLLSMEELFTEVSRKEKQFKGSVRIGVPIEFGNAMVLPQLGEIRKLYPLVQFFITYGLPYELSTLLMEGKLDFAFVDQYRLAPSIKSEVVYHENLILCCSRDYFNQVRSQKRERGLFENLSYVEYQPGEYILRDWFERGFGWSKMKLKVAAYSFDVQGIASLVKNSMGVGVLPEHVFEKMKKDGIHLQQFKPKQGNVNNPISLAYLPERWDDPLNQFVMNYVKERITRR